MRHATHCALYDPVAGPCDCALSDPPPPPPPQPSEADRILRLEMQVMRILNHLGLKP
jgi:hypothetical protein